jgi:hypothetical protein
MTRTSTTKSLTLVLAFAFIASLAAYGFTASNTVADSFTGDGSQVISGYTVSNVAYTTNDSGDITAVDFTLGSATAATYAAPTTLKIKLRSAGSWFSCATDATVTTQATCSAITGETVAAAENLRVLAHR